MTDEQKLTADKVNKPMPKSGGGWGNPNGLADLSPKSLARAKFDAPVSAEPVAHNEIIPRHVAQTLANAIYETAQKMGIANADQSSRSVGQCLHLLDCMSAAVTEHANAPLGWRLVPIEPTEEMLVNVDEDVGGSCHSCSIWRASEDDCKRVWAAMIEVVPAAPVAAQAQPDLIRFDYVNADGQPDSKMITHDEMRERYAVAIRHAYGQAQQPVSDADGLPEEPEYSQAWRKHAALYGHDSQHAFTAGWNAAKDDMLTHCVESAIHIAEEKVKAQQPVSSADQFRDAAQMIEPSGNSGELDELAAFEKWVSQFDTFSDEYRDMGSNEYFFAGYRAALDQQDDRSDWCRLSGCSHKAAGSPVWNNKQDAEKVDAEIDRAFNAVRKKLVALPRYSFLADGSGGVRCVKDSTGAWIPFDKAHALFDPVSVDAARKEQE